MHWTDYAPEDVPREGILGEIEIATGRRLPVSDALPDELIATVQALPGATLTSLLWWIHSPHDEWSAEEYERWWRAAHAALRYIEDVRRLRQQTL